MNNCRTLMENWNKFLTEEETIEEVTEEELSNLDDILHNLDPKDLSFNNIFGDRMRLVQPMKNKDKDLERLKKVLVDSGYTPDFKTGLATYYTVTLPSKEGRPTTMMLTKAQAEDPKLTSKEEVKKKQIKIGKLLQKGSRLYDAAHSSWRNTHEIKPEDFGVKPDEYDPEDTANVDRYRKAAEEATEKAKKDLDKLMDTFPDRTSTPSSDLNLFKYLAYWWNKKSTFYRENPEDAGETNSDYSIVYTRHPIDVMRMSDFDNIESCHSPPSRGRDTSYYKCAVAEAHGHGPVTYVVRNRDLDDLISKYGLEEASYQDLLDAIEDNDEEFFRDSERGTGEITPLSRVRLKKFVNPKLEISLAVPSTMTYGKRFPELYSNVSNFTKEKQEKELKKIEASRGKENDAFEDEKLNLSDWERFGGSYEDAGDYPRDVIQQWLGYNTVGSPHYDNTTEDNLELRGAQNLQRIQREVDETKDHYNRRYQAANIYKADVEDDGAGEYYIDVGAELIVKIPEDKLVQSAFTDATRKAIDYVGDTLKDYGYDEFDGDVNYTAARGDLVLAIRLDIENLNPEGSGYAYNSDNFDDIASNIDTLDDKADAITEIVEAYLKREGVMEGGALVSLARALEDESWYEWSYDVDDDYAPTSIELETATYVNFEDLIQKIPITFERKAPNSPEVFINFAGEPLALASQLDGGEDFSFKGWEVRSPEFEAERLGGFKDLDEVKLYVQDQVAKMILRPKGGPKTPRGRQSSRDYLIAVSNLMREAAGGEEGEFAYPYRSMWANGPDSDDEYRMMFGMELDNDTPDEVVENAQKIITETDDEDQLKEIFRTAFAKVAKVSGAKATVTEVKQYFRKFDFF